MEKTIEEIVLAECARLCPERGTKADLYEGAFIRRDLDGYSIYHYWGIDRGNSTCICSIPMVPQVAINPTALGAFHRLLGLETAQAVAETKTHFTKADGEMIEAYSAAEVGRLRAEVELQSERAKSAKLVEALESLKRNRTLDRFMIETFIDQALEAHKKGGANG